MSKMMQNIRTVLWLVFVSVVVMELVLMFRISSGDAIYSLEQLAALTTQMLWLGIIDKLLIVALFGTFVFETQGHNE
jgi:hypothetical protein